VKEVRPGLAFLRMATLDAFFGAKRFDDQSLNIHGRHPVTLAADRGGMPAAVSSRPVSGPQRHRLGPRAPVSVVALAADSVGRVRQKGRETDERSLGASLLHDLRESLSRDEIAGYLAQFGGGATVDAATRRLHAVTGDHIDLSLEEHRLALISWLRSWGVRHLRRADTRKTEGALRIWWATWGTRLPEEQITLNALAPAELADVGLAYDALRSAPAAARTVRGREIAVTVGDTATAKAMFALRPEALVPWDEPIRRSFGPPGGGVTYVKLLQLASAALDGLARRLGTSVGDLPELLGRPESSPPKLVDEYLLIRITKAQHDRAGPAPER
jgi:hypothetical protein